MYVIYCQYFEFFCGFRSTKFQIWKRYIFHIHALRDIYSYVVNQQLHTDIMCFIVY